MVGTDLINSPRFQAADDGFPPLEAIVPGAGWLVKSVIWLISLISPMGNPPFFWGIDVL
jgi:hypothetical protein